MVEESEAMEVENVTDYSRMLQEEMGTQIVVDHLHGKMKQAAKDEIMERFGRNEIQILVSTTVIEVGIDVPNATVMMIEKKFGKYTYDDGLGYFLNINDMSLKTLNWPYNESLLLTDETEFKNIINNPLYNENGITNYAKTSDPSTFGKNITKDMIRENISGQFAPFGTLRMHNFLDKENEKSGYHCDIDLLRCKNFYIIQ